MLILTIRTDKPEAEIGLYLDDARLAYTAWQAHRELAETIQHRIEALLQTENYALEDVGGIVVYKGPGSFTGLRIGLTVANALSYGLDVPIVASTSDDALQWITLGIKRLQLGENEQIALPEYGAAPHITQAKK